MAGVMGIVNTNTLSGNAAVMAFMAGDSGVTTCRAAFGVAMAQTTPGSGFEFGIDLKMQDPIADGGGSSGVIAYTKANIRMEDDVVVMVDAGVPVNGTTGAMILLVRVLCMLIRPLVSCISIPVQLTTQLGWLLEPSLNVDHKDPEVQVMLGLLENQRDYLMGLVAAQAKQLAELNAKLEAATKQAESQDGKSTV
jgi:hypothetical protein